MKPLKELKLDILNHVYDEKLLDIYVDPQQLDYQRQRYVQALDQFEALYGDQDVTIFSAPGRSEVGGNHTDHQHGEVLAASINLDCIAIVACDEQNVIKVVSDDFDIDPIDLKDLEIKDEEEGTSEALIRGVAARLKALGYKVGGFKAYMTSDVLVGAGLSSSAAFEVTIGTILSGLYNDMEISPVLIAQMGQYAENVYFKKPSGLMDQMASSVGAIIHIDFNDIEHPAIEKIDVDFSQFKHSLCIVDTKGSHANLTDDYAAIPQEMKAVAAYFGKEYLNEVSEEEFYTHLNTIREQTNDRAILRAMHWFEENKRVQQEVEALKNNQFDRFKETVEASGNSSYKFLQNIYSNHDIEHQSVSLALALSERILNHKGVCRVHGGGFAGTIQAFVPDEIVATYKEEMERYFGKGSCHILKIRKYGGIKVI